MVVTDKRVSIYMFLVAVVQHRQYLDWNANYRRRILDTVRLAADQNRAGANWGPKKKPEASLSITCR